MKEEGMEVGGEMVDAGIKVEKKRKQKKCLHEKSK